MLKNFSLEKELIRIDFSADEVPESVRNFRPDIYRDGDEYCIILGNDEHAVIGYGNSIEEAMKCWDEAYWQTRYNTGHKKNDQ